MSVTTIATLEAGPRRALGWGAALLTVGLAVVGVGEATEGGPIALAGLLAIIYGIHRFGRLGPEERPDDERPEDAAKHEALDTLVVGVAILAAGIAFSIGAPAGTLRYIMIGVGGLVVGAGQRAGQRATKPTSARTADRTEDEPASDVEPKAPRRTPRRKRNA